MKNKEKITIVSLYLIPNLILYIFFNPYQSEKLDNLAISLLAGLIVVLLVIFAERDFSNSKTKKVIADKFNSTTH